MQSCTDISHILSNFFNFFPQNSETIHSEEYRKHKKVLFTLLFMRLFSSLKCEAFFSRHNGKRMFLVQGQFFRFQTRPLISLNLILKVQTPKIIESTKVSIEIASLVIFGSLKCDAFLRRNYGQKVLLFRGRFFRFRTC